MCGLHGWPVPTVTSLMVMVSGLPSQLVLTELTSQGHHEEAEDEERCQNVKVPQHPMSTPARSPVLRGPVRVSEGRE